MNKEVKIQELRFGISVTRKMLDTEYAYDVRVPQEGGFDICIEAVDRTSAYRLAELIEQGGMVTIKKSLQFYHELGGSRQHA